MKELLEKIEAAAASFKTDASAQVETGNKAAGLGLVRSRWRLKK